MLRGPAILALAASVLLPGLLWWWTDRGEVSGTVVGFSSPLVISDDRLAVQLKSSKGADFSNEEFHRLVRVLLLRGSWLTPRERAEWTWEVELSAEILRTVNVGDEAVVRGMRIALPGDGEGIRHVVYAFRRGTTTWSAGEQSNWKFLAAVALAGGGPLLLWALAALTLGLGKARSRERSGE